MKKFFELNPEVPGQLGPKTEIKTDVHPPIVSKLDFIFDGWLGDDIIECFPCYLVSERLKKKLDTSGLTGFILASCTITKSTLFEEIQPDTTLPKFYWLKVIGTPMKDDFWISDKNLLIISDTALELIRSENINANCYQPYLKVV